MNTRNERLEMVYQYAISTKMCKNKKTFAELVGIRDSTLSKALGGDPKYLSDVFFVRVNSALNNVFNTDWLLTGNGEMLNGDAGDSIHHNTGNVATRGAQITATGNNDQLIATLQAQIAELKAQIDILQARIADLKNDKEKLYQLLLKQ